MSRSRICAGTMLALLLAACASSPEPLPVPTYDPAAVVAAIQAAGEAGERELVVNPLGGNQVKGLRAQAEQAIAARRFDEAAATLDEALQVDPRAPELLQLRAEVALWQRLPRQAEEFARRAIAVGTEVGPLCRRHWETVAQVREILALVEAAAGAGPEIAEARRQRDACTVAEPPRY